MKNRGFTLVELLVVLIIVAILSAVAIPSYSSYITKSKITVAQTDISALTLAFENQYQRVLSYPAAELADTAALQAAFSNWKYSSEDADFTFHSDNAASSTYTLNAVGTSGALAGCTISITHSGDKSISNCGDYDGGWM